MEVDVRRTEQVKRLGGKSLHKIVDGEIKSPDFEGKHVHAHFQF